MATEKRRPSREEEAVDRAARRPSGKNGAKKAKKKRRRMVLFIIEIFVLLIMLVVLYGVLKTEKIGKITINEEDIVINEEVENNVTMQGYRNIALFGVDARNGALGKGTRTDTIMIASINEDTKEVKLISVYRDTYLNLGNDSYNKANSAYAKGGPEQAINMLNMNLDMNITDYATVGFTGLVDTVDELGGVMIEVDEAEIDHLNNYQIALSEDLDRSYNPVKSTGYQLLDGMQATAYCRIRYTKGDDFKRAERQREVLLACVEEAKKASPATLNSIANKVFPSVATSLSLDEIISLLTSIADYEVGDNTGFPFETNRTTGNIGSKGSCVIPYSLEENVELLHAYLFESETYAVSDSVKEFSDKIEGDTSAYVGKSTGGTTADTTESTEESTDEVSTDTEESAEE
ncbi:MAG: LCP family protein [Lachnospiraceae bacterium]|nr:LCP family protein [Lachnospiraceae bacterium]MDD3661286.1 LCP family protein [Lachnospiraceae bacterium]